MLNLKDLFVLILTVSLVWWWRRKPLRDFAAQLPGLDGLPLIGILHKFYGIDSEGKVNSISIVYIRKVPAKFVQTLHT